MRDHKNRFFPQTSQRRLWLSPWNISIILHENVMVVHANICIFFCVSVSMGKTTWTWTKKESMRHVVHVAPKDNANPSIHYYFIIMICNSVNTNYGHVWSCDVREHIAIACYPLVTKDGKKQPFKIYCISFPIMYNCMV